MRGSLVTVSAGVASALLYLVSAKGSLAAVFVTYFTPLPLMIAALGWGQRLGLAAAVLGTALFAIGFEPMLGVRYAIGFGIPGWYLAYLALLARTDAMPASETPRAAMPSAAAARTHWYPLGHLVMWAVGAAVVAAIIASLAIGVGTPALDGEMRAAATRLAAVLGRAVGSTGAPTTADIERLATNMVRILPIAAAVSLTLLYLVNLWVAGRTVQYSHRLVRPWPTVPDNFRVPRFAGPLFLIGLAGSLLPGLAGLCARIMAASIGLVLALQALAVAHVLTRPLRGRGALLAAIYVAVLMMMPFSLVALTALGFADLFFSLRDRRPRTPPANPPPPH